MSPAFVTSDPAARWRTEQALRRGEQRDDEQCEHRHRREDAAHQERGSLLEQAQHETADDRAAVVAQAAERHRNEAVEVRSEEHTSELQSLAYLVCRLLLEKKK